jgi:conjugative transfer pilus assembly protein TraH
MRNKKNKVGLSLAFLASVSAQAGNMDAEAEAWYNARYSNVTDPQVVEAQAARYYTLGGISTRTNITQMPPLVNIQTPKLSAGCGGIDFYAGGFSAINTDEFVNNLRAIGQNAQSLAYMMAIQVVSPQLSEVMEKVQSWADKAKALNMDSCEAATQLVGGALDVMGAKRGNCTVKRMDEFGEDYTTANYACTTGGKIKATEASGDANKIAFVKGNLAWYTLMNDPFFATNLDMATIVMNITGTLIVAQQAGGDDAEVDSLSIPPALELGIEKERFKHIYDTLLLGNTGTYNVYTCNTPIADKTGCTTVSTTPVPVSTPFTGLHERIETLVNGIIANIKTDSPLTADQEALVSNIEIPIYRYLTVLSASHNVTGTAENMANSYTELIAQNILNQSILGLLGRVESDVVNLPNNMSGTTQVEEYLGSLKGTMAEMHTKAEGTKISMSALFEMHDRIITFERSLVATLDPKFLGSSDWE